MTTHAAARQRQRRVKRALAGGGATAQLHHVPGTLLRGAHNR